MKRKVLKDLNPETAIYVIMHAMLQKKNGRYHPTMVYKGEKNPEKALALAKADMGIREAKDNCLTETSQPHKNRGCCQKSKCPSVHRICPACLEQ